MEHEKRTYFVFQRGYNPATLKLGSLVMSRANPREREPYIFPGEIADLSDLTGPAEEDEDFVFDFSPSKEWLAGLSAGNILKGEVGGGGSSDLRIEGKSGRRYQIDRATEFLNKKVLQEPNAMQWLRDRLSVARKVYRMNKLKLGKSRYPQIWVVTGIQLASDVRLKTNSDGSSSVSLEATVPLPEPVLGAATALLGSGGSLGAKASSKKSSKATTEFSHKDERVWAARFSQLRVKFYDRDSNESKVPLSSIELYDPQDLGRAGMRTLESLGCREIAEITGTDEDEIHETAVANSEHVEPMMQDDWDLFDKYLNRQKIFAVAPKTQNQILRAKRALLIGSAYGGLNGVKQDIEAMDDLLDSRGFKNTLCYGKNAERDGIINALHNLVDQTKQGDTAVVYYSGHGGMVESPEAVTQDKPWRRQYIVPTDFGKSTEEDFRGITDVELSGLLQGLTAKTRNVTLIFDCCYAGGMTRGNWRPRALPKSYINISMHILRVQAQGLAIGSNFVQGNPNAVRVVAASSHEVAFEGPNSEGISMGRLTDELVRAIRAAGETKISWNTILLRVQEKLVQGSSEAPGQHPQVEGPYDRLLFSLDKAETWGVRGLYERDGVPTLNGGHLAGVGKGDVYAVIPFHEETVDAKTQIAKATVTAVFPDSAHVTLQYETGHDHLPKEGAKAFPLTRALPRLAIRVQGDEKFLEALKPRLHSSKFIRFSEGKGNEDGIFATAIQANGALTVLNREQIRVFERPVYGDPRDDDSFDKAISRLEALAQARPVLELGNSGEDDALNAALDVDICTMNKDQLIPLPKEHVQFSEDQKVFIRLANQGETRLYVSVLSVGFSGQINLLSKRSPDGIDLPPARGYTLGQADTKKPGIEFSWPDSVPKDTAIEDAFLVVTTEQPLDLRSLATNQREKGRRSASKADGRSKLSRMVHQISAHRVSRDTKDQDEDEMYYDVRRLDYKLVPQKQTG